MCWFTAIGKACRQHICAKGPSSCLVQKQPVKGSWCLSSKTKEICHFADFFHLSLIFHRGSLLQQKGQWVLSFRCRKMSAFQMEPADLAIFETPPPPKWAVNQNMQLTGNWVQEITSLGHLPELLQVFFLKEKKKTIKQLSIFLITRISLLTKQVFPQIEVNQSIPYAGPLINVMTSIHQIQFLMCTCFCLFACLFCCFIKRGKWTTTLKNSLAASYKIKPTPTTKSSNCTQGNLPQRNESKYPHKILCIKVFQQLYSK